MYFMFICYKRSYLRMRFTAPIVLDACYMQAPRTTGRRGRRGAHVQAHAALAFKHASRLALAIAASTARGQPHKHKRV